jgi:hypothetical protein
MRCTIAGGHNDLVLVPALTEYRISTSVTGHLRLLRTAILATLRSRNRSAGIRNSNEIGNLRKEAPEN